MNKTTPFPYHRYPTLEPEGLVELKEVTLQMIGMDATRRLSEQRYPDRDPNSIYVSGWMEHVQVAYVATRGVVLHLDDPDMIEACRNSALPPDATLNDLKIPYPAIEIRFHADSGIPPVLFLRTDFPEYRKFLAECQGKETEFGLSADEWKHGAAYIASAAPEGAKEFVYADMIRPEEPLVPQFGKYAVSTTEEIAKTADAFRIAAMAMLLRWKETKTPKMVQGVPARVARTMERRPSYRASMPRLYAPSHDHGGDGNGGGHEVRGHWRRAHFRVLTHPRYKRDADGRPKIIYVPVTAVKGGGKSEKRI